ncbi:MAG: hypothetical protein QOF15_1140, partial [Mycobacterium sp.]|nr:hypothetical protein [Mycobacterium sp.]
GERTIHLPPSDWAAKRFFGRAERRLWLNPESEHRSGGTAKCDPIARSEVVIPGTRLFVCCALTRLSRISQGMLESC